MTLRQHHSLVMLPDDGYTPRRFDPRIGVFATNYFDFGKPFDDDYQTALARRHRLVKADPSAEMSEPVEPVIYYLDPAVPEPYRTAFKIGGVWWSQVSSRRPGSSTPSGSRTCPPTWIPWTPATT